MNKQEKIQVEKEIERVSERVAKMIEAYWFLAIIVGLNKAYGYKEKGINKALKYIIKEVDTLSTGMIGLTDYYDTIEELTGVKIDAFKQHDEID